MSASPFYGAGKTRQTDRGEGESGQKATGRRKMEAALWGRIWIKLSSGDSSSSRINALKFFGFTLNGFKETAKAAPWLPGTREQKRQQVQRFGAKLEHLSTHRRT